MPDMGYTPIRAWYHVARRWSRWGPGGAQKGGHYVISVHILCEILSRVAKRVLFEHVHLWRHEYQIGPHLGPILGPLLEAHMAGPSHLLAGQESGGTHITHVVCEMDHQHEEYL